MNFKLLFMALGLLLLIPYSWAAEPFQNCCYCIQDEKDESMAEACRQWVQKGQNSGQCDYSETIKRDAALNFQDNSHRCQKSYIYGSFHGLSSYYEMPFKISQNIAVANSSEEVDYDGMTCLVFNDVDNVRYHAMYLSTQSRARFTIRGNQNLGVFNPDPKVAPVEEYATASSKVIINVADYDMDIQYSACAPEGAMCGYFGEPKIPGIDPKKIKIRTGSDPNKATCEFQGQLAEQTCCVKRKKDEFGKWSKPGEACPR